MVQYHKRPANMDYLAHKMILSGALPSGFRAFLHLEAPSVRIDSYGIPADPMAVYYSGYWIYPKAASLLPYNYYPEKEIP